MRGQVVWGKGWWGRLLSFPQHTLSKAGLTGGAAAPLESRRLTSGSCFLQELRECERNLLDGFGQPPESGMSGAVHLIAGDFLDLATVFEAQEQMWSNQPGDASADGLSWCRSLS
ncbi:MAG: hypothetical protein HY652_13940 [Acidobacteria bacterium]|nr:hypothetical protein [Acidobacteriota bacterium]